MQDFVHQPYDKVDSPSKAEGTRIVLVTEFMSPQKSVHF